MSGQSANFTESMGNYPTTFRKYWVKHLGSCYETHTQGFCEYKEEIMYYTKDGKFDCGINPTTTVYSDRVAGESFGQLECAAGQKRTQTGQCGKIVSFGS